MIHLPVVTELEVADYRLFPGHPHGSGIKWRFCDGLTLVAGINGLGKTTLLTMILRSLTGPYDLTSDGMPTSLDVVLPEKPVSLRRQQVRFFADRVADGAEKAETTLSATIGETKIRISRSLKNLSLTAVQLDGRVVTMPSARADRESLIQSKLANLMGLGSFVDVLLVLHHIVLYLENRPGTLWDKNAQRQLLRALCLEKDVASRVVNLERSLQSADSQARNVHARLQATRRDLEELMQQQPDTAGLLAELHAEQTVLEAEIDDASRLEATLGELDNERKLARLTLERAKIEREAASRAVERTKFAAIDRYFPTIDDTARLVLSRIMTDGHCLVCDSDAQGTQNELERRLEQGSCPVCGTKPDASHRGPPDYAFDQPHFDRARARAQRAYYEAESKSLDLRNTVAQYDKTLERLIRVRESIQDRERTGERIRSRLATDDRIREYESTLHALESQFRRWEATRAAHFRDLENLLLDKRNSILSKSNLVIDRFETVARTLLVENVRIVQVNEEPRYLQAPGHDRIQVPVFVAEMEAADRPGYVQRTEVTDVSESQREIIDLAFRITLMHVFFDHATFVMETPEASLDAVSMERIGSTLSKFAGQKGNRLVVTSNLTNTGVVSSLFRGSVPHEDLSGRFARVLDLMRVAAPNLALLKDRERYQELLENALSGSDS